MSRLRRKRGRPSNYRKSLQKNKYWEKVKRKVRIRDNFQCIICGCKTKLETHHIAYSIDGKSIIGNELEYLEWIATLCELDHQNSHNNIKHPLNPNNKLKLNVTEFKSHRDV
ncbi:hypothetical protein [Aquimarina sp. 2201CG5-10]|uniref:HNH endonuclease n=1 Tax=Aquimarina callyspongiae TaxID=3098150 RepID=UPI002AB45BAF|nr:hypothetical protein [Aquimarina sp. 2201CG5-10]MDY8137600.1 hypothetical protein [Aquimarina sp. 2201CG5-10]